MRTPAVPELITFKDILTAAVHFGETPIIRQDPQLPEHLYGLFDSQQLRAVVYLSVMLTWLAKNQIRLLPGQKDVYGVYQAGKQIERHQGAWLHQTIGNPWRTGRQPTFTQRNVTDIYVCTEDNVLEGKIKFAGHQVTVWRTGSHNWEIKEFPYGK